MPGCLIFILTLDILLSSDGKIYYMMFAKLFAEPKIGMKKLNSF